MTDDERDPAAYAADIDADEHRADIEAALAARGIPPKIARWFGVSSPVALAAWLPISTLAAALHASGRIRVVAVAP